MKKLLLIQTDDAYFLFETLQVLEKNTAAFRNYELTVLVDGSSLKAVHDQSAPLIKGLTSDLSVIKKTYDISVNLSLNESSWDLHGIVQSSTKVGVYRQNKEVIVKDLWSSYLLTLKARAPFLTFHLQDVYKNILGIKGRHLENAGQSPVKRIAVGTCSTSLFSAEEQEGFVHHLAAAFPRLSLADISEIDLVDNVSETLYIGPATLNALKFAEAGGRAILLTSSFQGFNLLPYSSRHVVVSAKGGTFKARELAETVKAEVVGEGKAPEAYCLYRIDHENVFGAYLSCDSISDDNYPFYQSHVVLWNFLLNLFDTNLEAVKCTPKQIELLRTNQEVLKKFIRLHDFAVTAVDKIHQEAKSEQADGEKLQNFLNSLMEIDKVSDQIAGSHSFLRPILDFYRIRRGQNEGTTLFEQSQSSFLTYNEEHQALQALDELFSVTLRRNEASI